MLYRFVQRHYWTARVIDPVRWALEGKMKALSIVLFAGGVIALVLTFTLALTRGTWGLTCFHYTIMVLPRYLLVTALVLLVSGAIAALAPHP